MQKLICARVCVGARSGLVGKAADENNKVDVATPWAKGAAYIETRNHTETQFVDASRQ